MLDNLNSGSARDGRDGHKTAQKGQREREVRSVVEREVPLGQQSDRVLSSAVHSWLDGELPEAAARKGNSAKDVEFWRNLSDQMERTRRLRTPEHVEAQIMAALPHHAPTVITPWFQREFVVTPAAAVAVTAAVAALTALITVALVAS